MQISDLIPTLRKALVPIHKEGYPFIAAFLVAAIILGWLWDPLFWIGLGLTLWCTMFFRDPVRVTPVSDDLVIAPADGRVSAIGLAVPPRETGLGDVQMQRISIFMNVFNCHVNRAPMRGRIAVIVHKPGAFLNADLDKASTENERNSLVIETARGELGVVQVAGLVARRIVCWSRENDQIGAGERFGLIRFGSRLDVYLPRGAAVMVSLGQTTIAGESIIARFDGAASAPVTRAS